MIIRKDETVFGNLTQHKDEKSKEFICKPCENLGKGKKAAKVSKNYSELANANNKTVIICNGCTGTVLSSDYNENFKNAINKSF